MRRDEILRSPGQPLGAASFGAPPYRFPGRATLTVAYESDPDAVRAALPVPLEPDGAAVSVCFIDAAESPFGAYRACAISLAARLKRKPVDYWHALFLDQDNPIFACREIWGFPATRGDPALILGENRVAGVLDLGYGRFVRASIPVAEANEPTETPKQDARLRATCKLIPGADGNPGIAQLVIVAPEVTTRRYWTAAPHLEADADGPLAALPIKRLLHGRYAVGDMTLPYGRIAADYRSDSGKN